jgi:hypothetical protein
MTPGQRQKHYLAGARDLATGTLRYGLGPRKTTALVCDLLHVLNARYPAERYPQLYVVVDHSKIHKANAVEQWLVNHPRFTLRLLPTDCPRANPSELLGMSMIAAPAIISGTASLLWWPLWKTLCT